MAAKLLSDDEFIKLWQKADGSPRQVAEISGVPERNIYKQRKALADKGIVLQTKTRGNTGSRGPWSSNDIGRAYKNQNEISIQAP
jgi:hypothetical protein